LSEGKRDFGFLLRACGTERGPWDVDGMQGVERRRGILLLGNSLVPFSLLFFFLLPFSHLLFWAHLFRVSFGCRLSLLLYPSLFTNEDDDASISKDLASFLPCLIFFVFQVYFQV